MGHQDQSEKQRSRQRTMPATFSELGESEQLALIDALVEGELEQLKTRLFSAMAHELRTPLASLRLAAGLLVSAPPTGATEEHRQLFQLILQSSDRMDLLINSLLDYARLEANHLQLNTQIVDLRQILESIAGLLEPHYRAKRQTLDLHLPEQPVNVYADPFRLKSAVQALLETACKRCPESGRLTMGCQGQEREAIGWVCDTGPSVPAEAREQIFTHAYWQTREDPLPLMAFGLGLPFAYGLMTLHGGSLWLAEPEAQKAGVCFHFRLPLAHP
jgi:signal transduction histidine kinase